MSIINNYTKNDINNNNGINCSGVINDTHNYTNNSNCTSTNNNDDNNFITLITELQNRIYFNKLLWINIAPICFIVIVTIGTIGNTLAIYVIISNKRMRNVTNFFLINLAVTDLAYLLICVTVT
ncbi:hypothetical protein HELRODRAFT_84460, partial [Helobdella robusta]|uniref:G-protein coupled receptors family 1 profile domain-containing protein n=1 Tax=Helobdella robusta TaxID=6412 RepID=T1G5I8_HELRO